jgi:hypothetical protein
MLMEIRTKLLHHQVGFAIHVTAMCWQVVARWRTINSR